MYLHIAICRNEREELKKKCRANLAELLTAFLVFSLKGN